MAICIALVRGSATPVVQYTTAFVEPSKTLHYYYNKNTRESLQKL